MAWVWPHQRSVISDRGDNRIELFLEDLKPSQCGYTCNNWGIWLFGR